MNKVNFRKIIAQDCSQTFRTGFRQFDFNPDGTPFDLTAYYERDQSNEYCSFVYEKNGEIIGVLCFKIVNKFLYLSRIGIKKGHQTIGNGFHLHKHLLDIVEKQKVKVIFAEAHLGVFRWFEEDLGYQRVHEFTDAYWGRSAHMMLLIG